MIAKEDQLFARSVHTAFVEDAEIKENEEECEKIYLAHLLTSQLFVLDGSGAIIWEFFEEPKTITRLVQEISEIFDVSERTVRESVEDFVQTLAAQGFLESLES